jgi:hypothetical protein
LLGITSSHKYGSSTPLNTFNNSIITFCNHGAHELYTLHTTNKLNAKTLEINLQQNAKTQKDTTLKFLQHGEEILDANYLS